jgi:hypothetical protein
MMNDLTNVARQQSRRSLLALMSAGAMAGGLSMLTGCNDDVVGSEAVPTPTPTATPTPPVAYTPTDSDRMNFTLQLHYLLAAYLQMSLTGGSISAALTTGSGTAGQVSGGRKVTFGDGRVAAATREVAAATTARITYLRRSVGNAVSAQPAINIAGGQGSPFQAIALPSTATAPTTFFDPYASDGDFLLGAVALFAVATSAITNLASGYAASLRGPMGALSASVAAHDSVFRNALFTLAAREAAAGTTGATSLFSRANVMSDGRDQFDGPGDRDQGIGSGSVNNLQANIGVTDANYVAIRRTPEQALGVLYANASVASSGAFFPAGMNGTIRTSGLNS